MSSFSTVRRSLLLGGLFALLNCSRSASDESASDESASNELASKPGALRIVSLHDVTSEIAVGLGLVKELVGVEQLVDPLPTLKAALANTPRVSSLESIVALHPTHVIGLEVTRKRDPQLVLRLEELGAQVVLAAPTSLRRSLEMLEQLAEVFQRGTQAKRLGEGLRRELSRVEAATTVPRPKVWVYDCCEPPFTAGGRGLLNELITRAGGANTFADLQADWGSVSWEAAVARKPDLVVIHAYDYEGQKDVQSKRDKLSAIPGMVGIPTVALPLGCSLGGLRSVEGLRRLRTAIAELRQ